ncbi:DUF1482 family protein [Serratia liquefaciens]|uniref:DUF1482 family protein n=1 Tax=Serratia liquefaciens TaxID=614 RepID=A0A515CSJ4_SERLI|nr:DUF1482 family protein [Serratia liquefaciens]QDL31154.1 DUF1482 family protein [Serratia liquefaciens]
MFGLFLLVCYTYQPCEFVPQGWVYPDQSNCLADIHQQQLPPQYECLPVDGVIPARPPGEKE